MPAFFRRRLTNQPQVTSPVDWGHPLAPRNGFVVVQQGGSTILYWRGGAIPLGVNQAVYDAGARGFGAKGVSTGTTPITLPSFGSAGTSGVTVVSKSRFSGSPTVAHRIYDTTPALKGVFLLGWNQTSSRWFFSIGETGTTSASNQWEMTTTSSVSAGDVVAFVNNGTNTGTTAFLNGTAASITQTLTAAVTPGGLSGQSDFYFANRADGLRGWVGPIEFLYYDQNKRTAAEVAELSKNIWQIFAPIPRRLFEAVAGNVTGTVNYTNANDTSSASGTTTVTGTVNYTNANDTSAASGTAGSTTGTVDYTNNDDTATASGWAGTVSGTVNYTNNNDTSSAEGTAPRTRRGAAKPLRKGYIIRGKKYFLTDDELAIMVALELETIKRSDIKVPTKGRIKPIPAATFQMVKAVAKKIDELAAIGTLEDDDEEEEELLSMLA